MKGSVFFSGLMLQCVFFLICSGLFASGNKEETTETKPVNPEFVFCITALDTSSLPPSMQTVGESVVMSFVNALLGLDYRFRGEEEAGYYRDLAWARSRNETARALQAKRNERDLLIYRGEPAWRYERSLKTVDEAIIKLQADFSAADSLVPLVNMKPVIVLTKENLDGVYPEPPKPGDERLFCAAQKADAFLTVGLSEYHQRLYLQIGVYTLYNNTYSFEDSILFSSEDFSNAMEEISYRLAAEVSGVLPSAILVQATPPQAITTVKGAYVRGGEVFTLLPGDVEIEVRADNYVPSVFPLELNAGELAEINIELTPLGFIDFEAEVTGKPGSLVYNGSLYMGQTPLTLKLPRMDFSYISVETPAGETGSVVIRDNSMVHGDSRFFRSENAQTGGKAVFNTAMPVSPEEKRVDRARRTFYGTYGALWFVLPISLLTAGIAGSYISANNYAVTNLVFGQDSEIYEPIYNRAVTSQYVQGAAYGVMGLALGLTIFQIIRYLWISGDDATPIVKSSGTGTKP